MGARVTALGTREDYGPRDLDAARAICLYVATRIGGLLEDVVVVGGLVPALLVGPPSSEVGWERHVGTKDVDLGLALRLLDGRRYAEIAAQLRSGGFEPDTNPRGRPTSPRWVLRGVSGVTIDFLIPPVGDRAGGEIHNLEADFGAYVTPGLDLAFDDRRRLELSGVTPMGERATRAMYVCEAGAFVVLKALALANRGREKDAYDLDWILHAYPGGVDAVASRVRALRSCDAKAEALRVLARDFDHPDAVGPVRAARFVGAEADPSVRTDVHGRVAQLLAAVVSPR